MLNVVVSKLTNVINKQFVFPNRSNEKTLGTSNAKVVVVLVNDFTFVMRRLRFFRNILGKIPSPNMGTVF